MYTHYFVCQYSWEPPASFEGSAEEILSKFWDRVELGGRDLKDANAFEKDELLHPTGPPRTSALSPFAH